MEPHARSSSPLAVLSTCALLALAGAGCGSSDKIGSVSDPTGAATPKPTTKFSAAGGLVSVSGKAGKGQNGNGNGSGGGGGDNGGGNGGGGNGGGGNGGGGHDHSGNGQNGGGNASFGIDSNPKTASRPGNVAGAVDCKSNDSGGSGGSGGSGECASTINCTNVHLPGTQDTQCCPFPIPSDQGGHKRKGSSSGGDCPTDVSGETNTSSESSSGKHAHKHKKSS